ncbi:dihydrolipoamide acetyltransferase family protein [Enterococcus alishanensis]|uniref:Dihydrolipoamide acetyltransferase component of pyruvate dehydrogenase complex n=1 Tax=Enterococcus alishanensis TaxID=1303817 RepID=A0ABS6T9Y1_9ENTE|nr:dihydrolipoamide acetyltransferase family protein [Enterococcus alishanensis]MBV7389716.1 2-oxo acid dehydrogenase subunit E2 [Enterococcus alishanensis]
MAHEVTMPKLSSTMDEGTITLWLKEEGDSVEIGEAIFEVMTDKIAIEVEAYEEGMLLKKYIGDGESAPVNSVIAYIGEAGEIVPETTPSVEIVETEVVISETAGATPEAKTENIATSKIRATPAARRIANEKQINLAEINGSGPKGRIQALDVKNYQSPKTTGKNSHEIESDVEVIAWEGMRKVIADRMSYSKTTIPHVTMQAEVNMIKAKELREQVLPMVEAQTAERISYTEIIMKATMVALKEFPIFNAHGKEDAIYQYSQINLGIAVAVSDGLLVPVIKEANKMGLADLTKQTKELTNKARNGQLTGDDLQGGTFTISSLGRSKVQSFNPIINAPEVAILGVGGMKSIWQMGESEVGPEFVEVPTLNLSLSFDHRVADGAPAAAFLSRIVELLENPLGLLL